MIQNIETTSPEIRRRGLQMADEIFGTTHPDYISATEENVELLRRLSPDSILYEVGEEGELQGWVVSIPTTQEIGDEFVSGKFTENKLIQKTLPASSYNAVYLCAAGIGEQYRRQGIALKLLKTSLAKLPLTKDYDIYAWPVSPEGENLTRKLEQETGKVIHIRHERV